MDRVDCRISSCLCFSNCLASRRDTENAPAHRDYIAVSTFRAGMEDLDAGQPSRFFEAMDDVTLLLAAGIAL